eukprot:scaffold3970_cov257-Pinguiococcus_pyrenoidosus.AAC.14
MNSLHLRRHLPCGVLLRFPPPPARPASAAHPETGSEAAAPAPTSPELRRAAQSPAAAASRPTWGLTFARARGPSDAGAGRAVGRPRHDPLAPAPPPRSHREAPDPHRRPRAAHCAGPHRAAASLDLGALAATGSLG